MLLFVWLRTGSFWRTSVRPHSSAVKHNEQGRRSRDAWLSETNFGSWTDDPERWPPWDVMGLTSKPKVPRFVGCPVHLSICLSVFLPAYLTVCLSIQFMTNDLWYSLRTDVSMVLVLQQSAELRKFERWLDIFTRIYFESLHCFK